MIEATATAMAKQFHDYLVRVEHGETVRVRKDGRAVARLVPDCEFMSGARAADLFRSHKADAEDKAAADAIAAEIRKLDAEGENALAH
jgi:antitoxin (DNA-binding transcriptional repressor) of toxin-antitoxin stability system